MAEGNHHLKKCTLAVTMDIIGGKWKVPILWYLSLSPQRYNQLKRCLGSVTNVMLTRALRDLEKDGFVERIQYEVIPPRVEYRISEKGSGMMPAIRLIEEWGRNWLADQ